MVGSPFFLIKVRLQVQSDAPRPIVTNTTVTASPATITTATTHPAPVGHQHHYNGALQGLYTIARNEGLRGLYRGASAAMVRVGIGSGVQLSTYDACKSFIVSTMQSAYFTPNSVLTHFCASMVSGLLVTLAMNPADVISTRMYNQPVVNNTNVLYKNLIDCAIKTARTEGLRGFYKGFLPHYLRLGPHTTLTFIFWEQLKQAATKFGI